MASSSSFSFLASLIIATLSLPTSSSLRNVYPTQKIIDCDIVIAGGSLSALAAAISTSKISSSLSSSPPSVCVFEITDWFGGQATSGGTSAIDFGDTFAHYPSHLTANFVDILEKGTGSNGTHNPGLCTVSDACFLPELFSSYALQVLQKLVPYGLQYFLNTVVIASGRDPVTGRITNITAVQRTPTSSYPNGYERRLSEALPDWYSPTNSEYFSKEVLFVPSLSFVIEASEFGDVLVTSGLDFAQGVEVEGENGTSYDTGCGQAATMCMWMEWGSSLAPSPDPVPAGSDENLPFTLNNWTGDWSHAMTWRRSYAAGVSPKIDTPVPGDIMLINSLNDFDTGVIFLSIEDARKQVAAGAWTGGMNLTGLRRAEDRAYGWYHYLKNLSSTANPGAHDYLFLNATAAGTGAANFLSKMPYLRESRRSTQGLENFRLCHWPLAKLLVPTDGCTFPPGDAEGGYEGYKWEDTIGIGEYNFDIHWLNKSFCQPPSYFTNATGIHTDAGLFYIPYRALTVQESPNLLVAGKCLSQSFWANSATRLHPEEWTSGTAAGAAAALMFNKGYTSTAQMMTDMKELQATILAFGQPLEWVAPNATRME